MTAVSSADVHRSGHVTRLDRLDLHHTCDEGGEDRDTKVIRPSDMMYGEVGEDRDTKIIRPSDMTYGKVGEDRDTKANRPSDMT